MKAKTKIALSCTALAAALAVSATSTYAWFTTSTTPTVNPFQSQVQAVSESVDMAVAEDLTAAKLLTDDLFATAIDESQIHAISNATLGAITTDDRGKTFKSREDKKATATTSASPNAANTYRSFVIAFRAGSPMDIKFLTSGNSKVDDDNSTLGNAFVWRPLTASDEYGVAIPARIPARVKNVARVGLRPAVGGDHGTLSLTAEDARCKIWDPHKADGLFGPSDDNNTFNLARDWLEWRDGITVPGATRVGGTPAKAGLRLANTNVNYTHDYLNTDSTDDDKCDFVIAGAPCSAAANDTRHNYVEATHYSGVPIPGDTDTTFGQVLRKEDFAQRTTSVGAQYYAYLQVNIWLEGWDSECLNSISKQFLSVGLGFEGII